MRKFKFVEMAFMALMLAASMAACSDDNEEPVSWDNDDFDLA